MAILGVAYVKQLDIGNTDQTKVDITMTVVGIASGQAVSAQTLILHDQSVTITGTTFELALKTAVRNYLTTSFGYSFGLLDEVVLIGATLL
jgi:hypothetical protein